MKEKTMKKGKSALRLITREEKPYCGVQSRRLCRLTGCLGRMQAKQYAGSDRLELMWKGPGDGPETEECREDVGRAAEALLSGGPEEGMEGRLLLTGYCFARRGERGPDPHRYRFRIDTEKYAYLTYMRQYRSGLYLLDFRCYRKDLLDRHLERAANGIRFTDRTGRELFVLPDGGRIRLTYPGGTRPGRDLPVYRPVPYGDRAGADEPVPRPRIRGDGGGGGLLGRAPGPDAGRMTPAAGRNSPERSPGGRPACRNRVLVSG